MTDWRIGDLALCIRGGRGHKLIARVGDCFYLENGDRTLRVHAGRLYTVNNVAALIGPDRQLALGFDESIGPWLASRFVKVTPTDEGAFDREVSSGLIAEPCA